MTAWTSWAVVIDWPHTKEELLELEGVVDGRDLPIFTGTLDEFCEQWRKPFEVHRNGRYIQVGVTV